MSRPSLPTSFRPIVPALAAALLLCWAAWIPERAAAQSYQEATGASYAAATMELALLASIVPMSATGSLDRVHGDGELALFLMTALAPIALMSAAGGIADASGAPAEVPLVWHGTLGMAISMALLTGGYASIFDERGGFAFGAVLGAVFGAAMGAAWSGLNAERLARDPEQAGPAHLMTWAPLLAAAAGFGLGMLIDDDSGIAAGLLGGVFGLAACMATLIWSSSIVESQAERAAAQPSEPSFYFPWSGTF